MDAKRNESVAHVVGWSIALASLLWMFWVSPLLPVGMPFSWVLVAAVGAATWVLLSRVVTGWHRHPSRVSRVLFGIAAGLMLAVAYGELQRSSHAECVQSTVGIDRECVGTAPALGPAYGDAIIGVLVAGVFVWMGTKGDEL